jgi:hypothetical protein
MVDPAHHQMPSGKSLDANEMIAVNYHGNLVGISNRETGQGLARMEGERQSLDQDAFPDFNSAGQLAAQEIANHTHASVNGIVDTAREVERASRAVRLFKLRHRLTREPREEERVWKVAIAGMSFIAIEGVCNMTALAEGMRGGLFQGLTTAMTLAAANVGAGVAAGFATRELLHAVPWRRFAGGTALAIYLFGLLSWALLLGHYRQELILHPETASAAAMADLTHGVAGAFASIEGVMLIGVTIGFGLLAMLSVMFTREAYPGYARLGRQLRQALAAYAQACEAYRRGIDAAISPLLAEVMRQRTTAIDARGRLRQHLADVRAVAMDYDQFLERVLRSVDQVCAHYSHVLAVALAAPVPAYTSTYDLGKPLDLIPMLDRVAKDEERLNDPALAKTLDRDVTVAMTEIRDSAAKAQAKAGQIFASCEARARGWVPAAARFPLPALPHFQPEHEPV